MASFKREPVFISDNAKSGCALVHCAFRRSFQIVVLHISPCRYSLRPEGESAPKPIFPVSDAGEGVLGPCGPRTGNSSGVRAGNSSGRGGSPGSCIGGGTSGRGLPGGLSCGGSDGCPGLTGGSSGGSIGIYPATLRLPPKSAMTLSPTMFRSMTLAAITAPVSQCSLRDRVNLVRDTPLRCCDRRDRARTRHNNRDDNARECQGRRCRARRLLSRPRRTHPR